MTGRKLVALSLLGTFTIVAADKAIVAKKFPRPRILVGLTIAFVILGFGAEFAPDLAAMFALLIFVSILLTQGVDVFAGLTALMNGKHPARQTKKTRRKKPHA